MARPRSRLNTTRSGRHGFTLIETLVAMSIFAIGLLGVAGMVPVLKSDLTRSDQRARAVILAEEETEFLRGLAFADTTLSAGTHSGPNLGLPRYERTWTVIDNDPIPGVKRVTVSVQRADQPLESATIVFFHAQAGR